MNQPQLAVVIIGRNEGQRLVDCIQAVKALNYPAPDLELIYVDSNSTDNSPAHAEALGLQVIIVRSQHPTAARGRNAGWQAATAPFILFLDGDTLVEPNFVHQALAYFADPKVAMVCGHLQERYPNASIYQRILNLDWHFPVGEVEFCGGLAVVRREVLEQVHGFNSQLIAGEEPEMCQRIRALGYSVVRIDAPMAVHDLAIHTWSQYWQRAVRSGHAFAEVSNLLRHTTTPIWQREARKNRLHAGLLIGLFGAGLLFALWLSRWWPLIISIIIYLLLSVRSAIKARSRSNNWITLLLYGIHAQFQHLPIAVGQLSFYYHHWRGKQRRLIEYK